MLGLKPSTLTNAGWCGRGSGRNPVTPYPILANLAALKPIFLQIP
ncbi:MAG: hypothetical protein QX199_09830 [Methylococcaceae bacterium]